MRTKLCCSNSGQAGELKLPRTGVCFGINSGSIHKSEQTLSAPDIQEHFLWRRAVHASSAKSVLDLQHLALTLFFLSAYLNPAFFLFVLTDFLSLLETGYDLWAKEFFTLPYQHSVMCFCLAVMTHCSQWYTSWLWLSLCMNMCMYLYIQMPLLMNTGVQFVHLRVDKATWKKDKNTLHPTVLLFDCVFFWCMKLCLTPHHHAVWEEGVTR